MTMPRLSSYPIGLSWPLADGPLAGAFNPKLPPRIMNDCRHKVFCYADRCRWGGSHMHVHLPKPLHGWRAFFGEVGIIVVGVLIALAAEQVVQAARERERAAHAEDAIRDELGFNLGRLQSRMNIHTCVERRLAEIQALLHSAAVNPQIETPGWIGRPQYWTYASSRWQAESQAGSASLVEPSRLSSYAIMYARMADMLDEMTFEQTD